MADKCSACNQGELVELVPGVLQCNNCRKVFKGGDIPTEEKKKVEEHGVLDGDWWMDNTTLSKKWEIADSGITVAREKNKWWMAVLLCHMPSFSDFKYIRISWWKKSINKHSGMIQIKSLEECENFIQALKRIDEYFDENFTLVKKMTFEPAPGRKELEENEIFDMKKRLCPNCGNKMTKKRTARYFECIRCGEIILIQEEQPLFNVPDEKLPLSFSTNYPVNYYLPDYGITTKIHMADWKAILIIHSKDNPDKKWLRFYWWNRDLQSYMQGGYGMGADRGLKWEAKKGVFSPNLYEKEHIPLMIEALETMQKEWAEFDKVDLVELKKKCNEQI